MKFADKFAAHKRVYFSTRARLIFVVLVALLPFAALMVYDAVLDRKAALVAARLELQSLSRMVSEDVDTQFTAARHLLRTLAETSGVRSGDRASCEQLLRGLLMEVNRFNNLVITDRGGDVLCAARGSKAGINLADREYFRHAVATRQFTVGAPIVGRTSNLYSVPIAWPVVGPDGVVEQLVIAGFNMSWLADRLTRSTLLPDMTTILWDRAGNILYQNPRERKFSAKLLQAVQQEGLGSIVESGREWPERQTFAISTPPPLADLGLTLAFGISSAEVESPIMRQLWERLSILLLTTAAIFVLAWRIAETTLHQPIARLAEASRALREGNLGVRASGPAPLGEIGSLMAEFNQTAAALELQTTTLQRANRALAMLSECKQVLVRSDDERMLLDLICERIVRFGGYCFAWVGYAEHDARKRVHPVARSGDDAGYLDSVTLSWADDDRGNGPAGKAIRDGNPVISDGFAQAPRLAPQGEAMAAGEAQSAVALPLVVEKETIGVLVIHARDQHTFHDQEMPLLRELAADIAYGIEAVRIRAARMRAEEETRRLNANLERRVLERTQELEAANNAKSAFLATMSHEIRTPMNGVLGMVEVLMHERLSEHQFDLVRTIRDSATVLLGIIDDILDFSKIEAGRLDIEQSPLNLGDLIESTCSALLPVAARRGVDLTLFISPKIPPLVLSDEVRLRQIIYNLVGNALKFSGDRLDRRGQVAVRVEATSIQPLRVSFRIIDNGIGIAAGALPTLFMPFTQVETSTTRRFGGTGLGLAICKRLVDLMNGDIVVASTSDVGSTFCVTLPFQTPIEQPVNALPDLSGVACLLVESPDLRADDLATYLEHAGARARFATSSEADAAAPADAETSVVTIRDAGRDESVIGPKARALSVFPGKGHLLMTWGQRRRCRLEALRVVTLDRDALRRSAFLNAVLVAAGRAPPEIINPEHGEQPATEAVAIDAIADARAAERPVLVVEDDRINQKVILQQLCLLGYAAEVASTGEEALQLWRRGDYALILTDLHMPGMDGYTLAEAIRKEEREGHRTPIVALTANALRGEANRARAIGMDDYLTKPVALSALRSAVERYLPPTTRRSGAPVASQCESKASLEILDVSVLEALVGNEPAAVTALLADYLKCAQPQAAQLREAARSGDTHEVSAIVHKLKSSSRAIGASALGDICTELEIAARAGTADRIAQLIPQFDQMYARLEQQIARELGEAGTCA